MSANPVQSIVIDQYFEKPVADFLTKLGEFAETCGMPLAIVGGPVRDCLLGIPVRDIDFVVGGDALQFVRKILAEWNNLFPDSPEPSEGPGFSQFGTAKLRFPAYAALQFGGTSGDLDFASARKESYPRPGRAPQVQYPCSIEEDLSRRDFSVNAMAFRLLPDRKLRLLDPLEGEKDLLARELRVLHSQSFVDDPARLIRGLRFLVRFGFRFGLDTEFLFRDALAQRFLTTLTPQRRFDEFRKALREDKLEATLELFQEEAILEELHPQMVLSDEALRAAKMSLQREARVVGAMLRNVPDAEYEKLLKDWGLSRKLAAEFVEVRKDVA